MIKQLRNHGWLAALTFASLFAPQAVIAQNKATKDSRPMLFGFMVDGRMVQARVVGGEVTATVTPSLNRRRGVYLTQAKGQSFPKKQMKVSKGLVRFMDKEGNVAAELTHWNGGGNLTVASRKVPVRLGITLAEKRGLLGRPGVTDGRKVISVGEIAPEGPADKAGMKSGDSIVEINGQKPATEELLQKLLKDKKPGDSLRLKVVRNGEELDVTAKLEAVPEKANPFNLVSGRLDPLVSWRRGQLVRAKKDIEMLATQQAALQALLKAQAAKVGNEAKKNGARLGPRSMPKDKKEQNDADTNDVFLRIQSELKKSSEKASERKKELDAKLDELKAEEARQNAMVWMNRANRVARVNRANLGWFRVADTLVPQNTKPEKLAPVKDLAPIASPTLQRLVLVDPKLTIKPAESGLGKQVSDLEKRLARMEKLLEESLTRQRDADKRDAKAEHLRNRKKEIDAKVHELKRAEGGEAKKDKDNTDHRW